MTPRLRVSMFIVLAVLVLGACSDQSAELTTTTSTAPPGVATTLPATTTTTIDPGPCSSAFCITYHIRPEAIWSDGTPVTSADFIHTLELLTDPLLDEGVATGYDRIVEVDAADEKTLTVGFDEVYGPWRTLFDVVLPAHVDDPSDFSVTAGAFRLHERTEADRIVLRRNSNYWATSDPASSQGVGDIDEIEFVFVESVRDRLAGLDSGEIHLINPAPLDWVVQELDEMEQVVKAVTPGSFWEHITFNHNDPLLSQSWVREVIALAIDRQAITTATLGLIDPNATTLDNTIWMGQAAVYEPHYPVGYNPVRAEEILQERSCARGDDGIYECGGRRVSFVWATTIGDEARLSVAESVRDSLASVGIELTIDLRTPSDLFSSEVFFAGPNVWQMIQFSWKASADPYLGNSIFYCTGENPSGFGALNVARYCDHEVESLIRSTDGIAQADERAAAYNEADRLYLESLAVIPLYQERSLLAWNRELGGLKPNMSDATDAWNIASWEGPESVVFALETEPPELEPFGPWNQDTALVMRSLLSGAYTTTPDLQFVPVLVEDADTWTREG